MTATSSIEFLVWLLIAASAIALLAFRWKIPYTVALVLGGLVLGSLHTPLLDVFFQGQHPNWLTPEIILILFLPPLIFEGSLHINFQQLRRDLVPILLLANLGVLVATLITGYAVYWAVGLPLAVALTFGAIISATDPISVLASFKGLAVSKRLSLLVESESLLNDGTAVVLFQILVAGVLTGELRVVSGTGQFLASVVGGSLVGLILGLVISSVSMRIDEPQVEITLTTILAYSAYLVANRLHMSGVIATVVAGIVVGNLAAKGGMTTRTRLALWSFWEYASFVINSLVFLLIGIEVHIGLLLRRWPEILLAIAAVLLGRVLSVYSLMPFSNLFARKVPLRWQHVLVWGGLHGSLSLALALSLPHNFPGREPILALTFGVVAFSIIVQGLSIEPFLRFLRIASPQDDEFALARVEQLSVSSARMELEELLRTRVVSPPVYEALRRELDFQLKKFTVEFQEMYSRDSARAEEELLAARVRLLAVQKSAIESAVHDGVITQAAAANLLDAASRELEKSVNVRDQKKEGDSPR